ncbi:hypothetical protein PBY51_016461 [Eleginops maclovinus]|uniref:Uncharacterized protein n=1 Tax=Eleginops maclovinus TaxID=56733 RepID=A0AAN8AJV2_ELEMC|nr:hypothetical protein PBY51_016461 [Eleginops maclovinus]
MLGGGNPETQLTLLQQKPEDQSKKILILPGRPSDLPALRGMSSLKKPRLPADSLLCSVGTCCVLMLRDRWKRGTIRGCARDEPGDETEIRDAFWIFCRLHRGCQRKQGVDFLLIPAAHGAVLHLWSAGSLR